MMSKKTIIILFNLICFSTYLVADGKTLYQPCAGCHGEQGKLSALQQSKLIGGQEENLTIKELTAYKYGELNQYGLGNIMKMQLKEVSENNIADLANFIANMERNISKEK